MALVETGWEVTVSFADAAGDPTTRTYNLIATDATGAAAGAAAILAALANVTQAEITGYRITQVFTEDALNLVGAGDVDVTALMTSFIADEGSKKGNYSIPAPLDGLFVNTVGIGRNIINTALPAVLAYHGLFGGPGQVATFSDGEEAGGLIKGVRVVGRKRQRTE